MGKQQKLIQKILSGRSDKNIDFKDLVGLMKWLGFRHRQEGSHNIFTKPEVNERINLQADGAKAKRYQVKQIRNVLISYNLGLDKDDE